MPDERHALAAIHSTQRLRYLDGSLLSPVCVHRPTPTAAAFFHKRTTTKYAHSIRQSQHAAGEDGQDSVSRTYVHFTPAAARGAQLQKEVLPLVYNALESEHAVVSIPHLLCIITAPAQAQRTQVQERALKAIPDLCETIDYAEVQGILFPRVAVSFHSEVLFLAAPITFHSLCSRERGSFQSKLPL